MATDEDVELDPRQRSLILEMHDKLEQLSFYELLGVEPTADKKKVQRAYFQLVGQLHPDRFFGKRLGSFKPKMEKIFARVTEAYETLTSLDRRAGYDAKLGRALGASPISPLPPKPGVPTVPTAPSGPPVDPKIAAERKAAMDALKQRFVAGKSKVKELTDAAARARASGDSIAAAEALRNALVYAPTDAALKAEWAIAQREADEKLGESHRRKAKLEERYGHWAEAAASWKQLLVTRPDDAEAREHLAAALARIGGGT